MELPFLKKKNKQGGGPALERVADPTNADRNSMDDVMSQVWDELLQAIETKDKALGMDALTALVLHIQDEDAKQDQGAM